MKFMKAYINNIKNDKLKHIIAGLLIYSLVGVFNINFAIILVLLIAFLKEAYDYLSEKGTVELSDFNYTIFLPVVIYAIEKNYIFIS